MNSEVLHYADFSIIRYAQCWEDADVLLPAMKVKEGGTYLSIASAGDNSLSLLTGAPEKVIAIDMNPAQIACVELRRAAYAGLEYEELLAFAGIRPDDNRIHTYERLKTELPDPVRRFWDAHPDEIQTGFYHAGKFERYFHLFRRLMKWIHTDKETDGLLAPKSREERIEFYNSTWNNLRWKMIFKVFFSKFVMGRLGRDPAFFKYVDVPVSERILQRAKYAMTELDTAENPYLTYILKGNFGTALPYALRRENFEAIRSHLNALETRYCSVEDILDDGTLAFDGYNLSDIFEYMSEVSMEGIYRKLLRAANPDARAVYWNMLAPRSAPVGLRSRVIIREEEEKALFAQDKAFFYSALHIEELNPKKGGSL